MPKPKLIIPKMMLTLKAKDAECSPSMPDLVQTVDRSDLSQQQRQASSANQLQAGSLGSRFRMKTRSLPKKKDVTSGHRTKRLTGFEVGAQRAASFSGSDTALFRKRREHMAGHAAFADALNVDSCLDYQDSGNSSCNDSEIINVQASDFAKLPPTLRVRCQSLDILDTVSESGHNFTHNGDLRLGFKRKPKQAEQKVVTPDSSCIVDSNDDSDRTVCSGRSANSDSVNEGSTTTLQDMDETVVEPASSSKSAQPQLQSQSADRFVLKGILKKKETRSVTGEKITFMTRCDDCNEYVRFMESKGKNCCRQ